MHIDTTKFIRLLGRKTQEGKISALKKHISPEPTKSFDKPWKAVDNKVVPDGDCSVHNLDFDNRHCGNLMDLMTQPSAWSTTLSIFPLTMTVTCQVSRKTSSAQLISGGKH